VALHRGLHRGYYGAMVVEAARTVFRGMGVNPNAGAEPVQGTLERWLHWTGQWGGGPA